MSRFRSPEGQRRALLLSLALLGSLGGLALGQMPVPVQMPVQTQLPGAPAAPAAAPAMTPALAGPAQPPETVSPCDAGPEVLSVTIGGLPRGDLPVRRVGEVTWVPADALRADEAAYGAAQVQCDGRAYTRLAPALDVRYDPGELSLDVQAAAALLPGGVLDFNTLLGERLTSLPAFSVSGRFDVLRSADTEASGTAGITLGVRSGRLLGAADLDVSGVAGGEVGVVGGLRAGVVLDNTWTVSGVVRLGVPRTRLDADGTVGSLPDSGVLGSGMLGTGFSGVEVTARSPDGALVPELTLDLPLDAQVTLLYEDRQLARFRAPAGPFRLRNLPLPAAEGELLAFVEDARGTRIVVLPFSRSQLDLRAGAYAAQVQAGVENGAVTARASGAYGLERGLTVQGRARLSGQEQALDVSLGGPLGPGRARVGAGLERTGDEALAGSLQLGYAAPLGPLGYAADLNIPAARPLAPSAALALSYNTLRLQTSLSGTYDFASEQGALRVSGTYLLSPQWTVQAQGTYGGAGRYGVGLGLSYRLPGGLVLGAGASAAPVVGDSALTGSPVRGVVSASLGDQQLQVFGAQPWGVAYTSLGVWPLSLYADGDGTFAARGELGFTVVAGRVVRGVPEQGSSLLVRTGVPGLPVRLSGGALQRADARGDLFFTGLPTGSDVVLQVETTQVSFQTEITDNEQPLRLGVASVALYDWSANFRQRRWVRLLWPGGEAAPYATLTAAGTVYLTDLDGNVLIDARLPAGTPLTLRSDDGRQSCTLTLGAGEVQRCP